MEKIGIKHGKPIQSPNRQIARIRYYRRLGILYAHHWSYTSNYGWRRRRMHRGVDLSLHIGDTIRAAFSGKVRLTRYERRGYGYYVIIRHGNGLETIYGHLSKFLVKPDQIVKVGEPIALGGNTGRSTGPHLHFETRYLGMDINPNKISTL